MTLLDSLLDAIIRLDGDALVMHVGEKPYVVTTSSSTSTFRGPLSWGQVELSSRPLTGDAVLGMLGQMLTHEQCRQLYELGAIEHEIVAPGQSGERFIVTAARGGDDVWVEVRRRQKDPEPAAVEAPTEAPQDPLTATTSVGQTPQVEAASPVVEESPSIEERTVEGGPTEYPLEIEQPVEPAVTVEYGRQMTELGGRSDESEFIGVQIPIEAGDQHDHEESELIFEADVDEPLLMPEPGQGDTFEFVAAAHPFESASESHVLPSARSEPPREPTFAARGENNADQWDDLVLPSSASEHETVAELLAAISRDVEVDETPAAAVSEPSKIEAAPAPMSTVVTPPPISVAPVVPDAIEEPVMSPAAVPPAEVAAVVEQQTVAGLLAAISRDVEVDETPAAAVSEPFKTEGAPAPVSTQAAPAPVSIEAAAAPVAAEAAPAPVSIEATPAPVSAVAAPAPVSTEAALAPVSIEAAAAPVAAEAVPAPVSVEAAPDPVAAEAALAPVSIDVAPAPVAAEAAPAPVSIEAAPAPVAAEAAPSTVSVEAAPAPISVAAVVPAAVEEPVMSTAVTPSEVAAVVEPASAATVHPIARPVLKLQPPQPPPPAAAASTEASLVELLRTAVARRASTLYAVAGSRPMIRVDAEIEQLGTEPVVTNAEVERFALEFAPREQVADAPTEWTCAVPGIGRVRSVTFHDHSGARIDPSSAAS